MSSENQPAPGFASGAGFFCDEISTQVFTNRLLLLNNPEYRVFVFIPCLDFHLYSHRKLLEEISFLV